jgi:hypothetical protein
MVAATVLFRADLVAQRPGYDDDEIRTLALVLGIAAELLLATGGNIGGRERLVYGIRVLNRPDTPVAKALNPLGVPPEDPHVTHAPQNAMIEPGEVERFLRPRERSDAGGCSPSWPRRPTGRARSPKSRTRSGGRGVESPSVLGGVSHMRHTRVRRPPAVPLP